jgi:hypothetical protein
MTTQAATKWQDWLSFALGLWLAMSLDKGLSRWVQSRFVRP